MVATDRRLFGLVFCKILSILLLDDLEYVSTYEYQPAVCNYFIDGRSPVKELFYDQQNHKINMRVREHIVLTVKNIDAFEQYPFRMNIWDAESLTESSSLIHSNQWMAIFSNYKKPESDGTQGILSRQIPDFYWNGHGVWIVMDQKTNLTKTLQIILVPRSSNENKTYMCCHLDGIYLKLTLGNCCCSPYQMPYQIPTHWKWFVFEHGGFLYFFFPTFVQIVSTSLLDVPYKPRSSRSFLRYTNLSYEKFIVCQKKYVWFQILKFHRSNPYIYGVHMFNIIVVSASLYCLYSFCFDSKKETEYELDEWIDEFDDKENDPNNPNQDLIAFFTRLFRKAPPNFDDRVARTIPMLNEKPKFQLIMSPPHRKTI